MEQLPLTAWLAVSYCLLGLTYATDPRENELGHHDTHLKHSKSPATVMHGKNLIIIIDNISI